MKFEAEARFYADFRRLSRGERKLFMAAVDAINVAYARRGDRPLPRWPAALRVKPVQGTPGVF